MAPLSGRQGVLAWLADRFELSRGGPGSNLLPMEGLRGFAVFLVFVVHFATLVEPWLLPGSGIAFFLGGAHSIGHAGVDLFFVLSGYLIYGHLISKPQPFLRYFGRRVRRIYPTFLAVFALYVVLSLLRPADSKIPGGMVAAAVFLVQNLLLLPGILPIEPLITVAWSLSYEMFYYLAMPILIAVAGLHRRSGRWRTVFLAVFSVLAMAAFAFLGGPVRLGMFLAGVLLFELMQMRPARVPGSAAAFVSLVAALAAMLIPMPGPAGQALRVLVLSAAFFVLCLACFAREGSAVARCFCWTPLRWLGNMSYSYYLLHGLTLKVFFTALALVAPPASDGRFGIGLALPAFVLTLLPTALLFLFIERPFSLQSNRPPARDRAGPAPAKT